MPCDIFDAMRKDPQQCPRYPSRTDSPVYCEGCEHYTKLATRTKMPATKPWATCCRCHADLNIENGIITCPNCGEVDIHTPPLKGEPIHKEFLQDMAAVIYVLRASGINSENITLGDIIRHVKRHWQENGRDIALQLDELLGKHQDERVIEQKHIKLSDGSEHDITLSIDGGCPDIALAQCRKLNATAEGECKLQGCKERDRCMNEAINETDKKKVLIAEAVRVKADKTMREMDNAGMLVKAKKHIEVNGVRSCERCGFIPAHNNYKNCPHCGYELGSVV